MISSTPALLGSLAQHAGVTYPPAEKVTPGTAGFVTMFLLALAVLLLIRSMVVHLRRVRYTPEEAAAMMLQESTGATSEGPTGDGTVARTAHAEGPSADATPGPTAPDAPTA